MILLLLVLLSLLGTPSASGTAAAGGGQVVQVDKTWTCTSKVDLDLVKVTITRAALGDRRNRDAVHLRPGCTGRIGQLEVVQWVGDGVKVAEGAHDLTIGGGSIRCLGKAPVLHQDGIQVLGGSKITFHDLAVDCGRRNARLINSNFFVNQAGQSLLPPRDVVCDGCSLGGWAAHTVSVQRSVRSGVENSTICVARYPQLTLKIGALAIDPVHSADQVRQCGPGLLTLDPGRRTVGYGSSLPLHGFLLGQAGGSPVAAQVRPFGSQSFRQAASTKSHDNGRFQLFLRPAIGETVQLRSGSLLGPVTHVRVRPRLVVKGTRTRIVLKVIAARSYTGRTVVLRVFRGGRWDSLRVVLGRRSKTVAHPRPAATLARMVVPAGPGYAAATSSVVILR